MRVSGKEIKGFSKLSKADKRRWVATNYARDAERILATWQGFDHPVAHTQEALDHFSENTLANFPIPFGVAPNFLIDGKRYAVPMAIEESSVVAAASAAAKYWSTRGGFKTTILGTEKIGQLLFNWSGDFDLLTRNITALEKELKHACRDLTLNMEHRGGGILRIEAHHHQQANTYELRGHFETCDSMGANFINTILERWGDVLVEAFAKTQIASPADDPAVVMAILSNYTPGCVVRAEVSCHIDEMGQGAGGFTSEELSQRFHQAIEIARVSPYRATTHNKGICNGIDAVVLATGNDFRAVEACAHAYAARDGQYRSLSHCTLQDGVFRFWLEVPLALGTVGGLTKAHPLAATALEILDHPSAQQLMRIVAATGLAQNFAAVRSLVTTGIQSGHMRMHLQNILTQLEADPTSRVAATKFFSDKQVSVSGVRTWLEAQ